MSKTPSPERAAIQLKPEHPNPRPKPYRPPTVEVRRLQDTQNGSGPGSDGGPSTHS